MRKGIVILAACLVGCATRFTPEQLAAKAREETTPNLCAITLMAVPLPVLNAAENEVRARNAQCDWDQAKAITAQYYARQQAQAAANQAWQANLINALATSSALLQQSGPHYYSAPPVHTTCVQQGVFMNCDSY